MSFKCQSQTNATAKASNTVGISGSTFTMAGWFRRDAAQTSNGCIIYAGTGLNGMYAEMATTANGGDIQFKNTNGFNGSDSVFSVADGEWVYVAIIGQAGAMSGYAWRDTTVENRTSLGSNSTTSFTPDRYIVGGDSGVAPYWVPARGEYCHVRYWNAALTTAELNAERTSTTPVKTTSLVASHPLASATDNSDNSGNNRTLTIVSSSDLTTGSSTPSSLSAVTPTVSSVSGSPFSNGTTGLTITGTGFGGTQGTGVVKISPTNNVNDANAVTQTINGWGSTSINFTAVRGALAHSTNMYLFVKNDSGNSNTTGYTVQFAPDKKLKVLVHSSAAGATNVSGVVFAAPTGGAITGTEIGEFTGKSFEASLESGQAVLKVLVTDFGGGSLSTSDTPVALVRNATNTTGIVSATVIQE